MAYTPAQEYIEDELKKLAQEKAAWRKERDSDKHTESSSSELAINPQDKSWHKEHWEYMLGNALIRIAPEERGIELLGHPLYQVRQGAIRALASRIADGAANAVLIGNMEYTGTENDLKTLKDNLANLKPCQIPGQDGAIKERLEWTIKRLEEKLAEK